MRPYKYQLECLEEIEQFNGRSLVSLAPGLGKTAIALWFLTRSLDHRLPAIVVCPASVKWQWKREARRVLGQRARIHVIEGQRADKRIPQADLVIVNYDILMDRRREGYIPMDWVLKLQLLKPKTVILDEVQATGNRTQKTAASRSLCYHVPYVLGLSGTPLLNRPWELFNSLNIIRPDVFRNRFEFGHRYCDPKQTPWGWQYKGASRLDELHKILTENLMVRRRKEDVLPDLPAKVRRVITLPLRDEEEYQQASTDFLRWLAEKKPTRVVKAIKAQALVKVGYLLQLAARLKIRYAVEWINQFLEDTDEKLVIYAIHKQAIKALARTCKAKSVIIDGSVTGKKRLELVERFRKDQSIRLMIGNIRAAGTGIDGLQVASNVVFFELPWQPGAVLQAEDRIYRIGTTKEAWIWFMVAKDTIEVKLCKLLQQKQEILSSVLDGGEMVGDFDVFNKLIRQLAREKKV
jgi:SWI/SNF-related matrix-associated actin-dependent regulator 1 of chromatin subfamily A